ncbi:alpha/beta hydrolase family protein [Leptospira ilyithenensis]|uniref:Alpha/beta hydrolase n=1 Tax=Leptospira ilyithenensis TaxID=2484901 RepID=A0A4R9LSF7_9LEPT|nr:alpha/beta hydrolase [Leptospira ilyithenensis]TGN14301.1 alpha/beta hydrolase [Leptospira ilyithenensis]
MRQYLLSFPLISLYGGLIKNKKIQSESLTLKNKRRASVYWPAGKNRNKLPGIYLQHGMSILGIDDQRIIDLAENLAYCGFSVILPELVEVRGLLLKAETVDHIEELGIELSDNQLWYDGKRFGYFSVSFSGGMGLIAFSRPKLAERVSSIMAVGAYSDFLDTFPFVFENYDVDNYGVLVLLYNLINRLEPKLASELLPVFYEAAVDNALLRTKETAKAPVLLKKTKKVSQDFYHKVTTSTSFREEVAKRMLASYDTSILKAFSPYHNIKGLKAPVSLLHGETDPVISPKESEKLADYFQEKNHKFIFRTSSALVHGDQLPLHTQIAGIPALLQTFGSFFKWLKN